ADDTEAFREASSELAGVLAERLDAHGEAEGILEELLVVDPGYVPALLSLAAVHEARGDEDEARATLERAAQAGPSGAVAARLELRLAALCEDMRTRGGHLARALEHDPGNAEATAQMLDMAREAQSWVDVVRLLEMSVARISDSGERRKQQLERVDILFEHLDDIEGGLRVLASVYEEEQEDVGVNERIADGLY